MNKRFSQTSFFSTTFLSITSTCLRLFLAKTNILTFNACLVSSIVILNHLWLQNIKQTLKEANFNSNTKFEILNLGL